MPNTKIDHSPKTRVDGLYLLVTNPANPANLTVGTQLFVAHSEAIADR
jgi:hypothetical protein